MHPEREVRESVETISALVIVQEATAVPPTTALIFCGLGWFPFPGPIELNGRASTRCIIPYKLHIGIILQVGIRVKFSGYQIVELLRVRRMCECEPGKQSVGHFWE